MNEVEHNFVPVFRMQTTHSACSSKLPACQRLERRWSRLRGEQGCSGVEQLPRKEGRTSEDCSACEGHD